MNLSKNDLAAFQKAIKEDYGLELEGDNLYQAAFGLLQFINFLVKFDKEDKDKQNNEKVLKPSSQLS